MKTVKGFDSKLKCRDFQYEIGKTYTQEGEIKLCKNGFHAINEDSSPLSVFGYYPPTIDKSGMSRYCEVKTGDIVDKSDNKVVTSQITIGAEIGIPGIVKAHVEWVKKHLNGDDKNTNTGNYSAATNTGDYSAATNTGFQSAATNTGFQSAATNTGNYSAATNTGDYSAATNTGFQSAATNTGFQSAATNTGDHSAATNTGDYSAATNTGNYSAASVEGMDSVAIATGFQSKVRGSLGCAIVVAERGNWNGETYPLLSICSAIVDGVKIKANTWYTVENGEFVEVNDNEE